MPCTLRPRVGASASVLRRTRPRSVRRVVASPDEAAQSCAAHVGPSAKARSRPQREGPAAPMQSQVPPGRRQRRARATPTPGVRSLMSDPLQDARPRKWGGGSPAIRRHEAAVARSLAYADAAAQAGDLLEALAWLEVLDRLGDDVPKQYLVKQRAWRATLGHTGAA